MFDWNGRSLITYRDMMDEMEKLQTKEEARAFIEAFRPTKDRPEGAEIDIGYLTGYFDHAEMLRLQDLFDVSHPIFGRA